MSFLAEEFEHNAITSEAVRNLVNRADPAASQRHWFEVVVDNPMLANWRLKFDDKNPPWGLRVGYYGMNESAEVQERLDRINAALAEITGS